ncbi:hypothetical protein BDW22DRAFT_1363857 [Trametopsis cervina]|nr:hypothetical protein BDW22DRAFT_1363857 [Trametopsis cervina]
MSRKDRSSDWDLSRQDVPKTVMPSEFKSIVEASMMSLADAQGYTMPAVCEHCNENMVVAVAKKKTKLGQIFVNCNACETYDMAAEVDIPKDVRDYIEGMRAEIVAKWRAREGPQEYCRKRGITLPDDFDEAPVAVSPATSTPALTSSQTDEGSILVPATPPPTRNRSAASSATLASPLTPFPSSQRHLNARAASQSIRGGTLSELSKKLFAKDLSSPISIGSWESSSPAKTSAGAHTSSIFDAISSDSDSSDIEIIEGPVPMKQTSTLFNKLNSKARSESGTKTKPIAVGSSQSSSAAPKSASSSASVKRKQEDTDIEDAFLGKKRKTAVNSKLIMERRLLKVVIWYKVDGQPLIIEEKVPPIFSIADLTETCAMLKLDTNSNEQLLIWRPEDFNWKPYTPQAKIGGYAEHHKAILIRREGVANLPRFWEGGAMLFGQ